MGRISRASRSECGQDSREPRQRRLDEGEGLIVQKTNFAEQSDIRTRMQAKNGLLYVERIQDVEPYLKQNAALRNSVADYKNKWSRRDRPMRLVADIPNVIAEKWLKEGINVFSSDPDMVNKVRKKLDEPEYRHLKTHPGRIGVRRSQRF
jgi:hypothetical protein